MTKLNTIKTAIFAGLISTTAMSTASTTAQALVIYNCTKTTLPVVITHVPTGRNHGSKKLKQYQKGSWNTGRGGGFRVGINVIGPDKFYSNFKGNEIRSIMIIAGNTEMVAGKKCSKPRRKPVVDEATDYRFSQPHYNWCFRTHGRHYNPSTNRYRDHYGVAHWCRSPFDG